MNKRVSIVLHLWQTTKNSLAFASGEMAELSPLTARWNSKSEFMSLSPFHLNRCFTDFLTGEAPTQL